MARQQRVMVQERERLVVLIDAIGCYAAGDDLAEDAGFH